MHFELCYYLPIEWAIQNGIKRFEAGAQGDHKLKRGFLPKPCYSAHWIEHLGLAESVYHFLEREADGIHVAIARIEEHSPFKQR
jgi:predicted N-acyltransferase